MDLKLNVVGLDSQAIVDGRWFDYVDYAGNRFPLKIASAESPEYLKAVRNLTNEAVKELQKPGDLSQEERNLVVTRATAVGILRDWKGIKGADGKDIKYTPEIGFQVLNDARYQSILVFVIAKAKQLANFAEEVEKDQVKK